jgi:hypothetical protein
MLPLLVSCALAVAGLEVSVGPLAASLSPYEEQYDSRFLTPGTVWGGEIALDSPGILGFRLRAERFIKDGSRDWDGRLRAWLLSIWPVVSWEARPGISIHGGPGAVYCNGSYEGTDDFGRFVEGDGGSVGIGLTAGAALNLWGPVSASLAFTRSFMDMKTDEAIYDGTETIIYPPEEFDLGYYSLSLGLSVSIHGGGRSVFR